MLSNCNFFNDNKLNCNKVVDSNNLNRCIHDNNACIDIENIYAKNIDLYNEIIEIQSNTNFLFGNVPRINKKPERIINVSNLFILIDMFFLELYNLYTENDGVFYLNIIENYRQNIIYNIDKKNYNNNHKIEYCNYYNKKLIVLFKTRGIDFSRIHSVDDTKKENFFKKTILKLLFIYDYHNKDDKKEEKKEKEEKEKKEDKKYDLEYIIKNNRSFNYINQYYNPDSISTLFLTKKIIINDTDKDELKKIVEHTDYPTNEELKFLENLGMHSNLAHFVFHELVRVSEYVLQYNYIPVSNNILIINDEIYKVIIKYLKLKLVLPLKYNVNIFSDTNIITDINNILLYEYNTIFENKKTAYEEFTNNRFFYLFNTFLL